MLRKIDDCITLVGTAHISLESAREVERAILDIRPDIVAVELDEKRYLALTRQKRWERTSIYRVIRTGKGTVMLIQIFLGTIQKRLGLKENVRPGQEMISAINIARENNIPIALVDRDIAITFRRGWQAMGFFEKFRLFWYGTLAIFGGSDEELDEVNIQEMLKDDVLTVMINELKEFAPGIGKAFIDERDTYIALRLLELRDGKERPRKSGGRIQRVFKDSQKEIIVRKKESGKAKATDMSEDTIKKDERKKVLGIVGAGHLAGIERNVKDPKKRTDINRLNEVKKKRFSFGKCIGYTLPVLLLLLVGYLIYIGDYSRLGEIFLWWFLINGTCSALGALIAGGHPLSIVTAFFAAPLTSLNPLLAAGWFAGLVEANIRVPRVLDMEKLGSIERFRDFFKNRLVRVLLVAALANLGSVIGTYVAAAKIIEIMM